MVWPPEPSELYLPHSLARPIFQGDVFDDVPFLQGRAANSREADPNVVCKRRAVAVLNHPCELYGEWGGMGRTQRIAAVREAKGVTIPANWDGAWAYCPLPDLYGDGPMWIVDLGLTANIDRAYLDRSTRLRSLSEYGWAIFRQRIAANDTRTTIHLQDLIDIGQANWQELSMWQSWNEAGRAEDEFQAWLSTPSPNLSGLRRRTALDRGMYGQVSAELGADLA